MLFSQFKIKIYVASFAFIVLPMSFLQSMNNQNENRLKTNKTHTFFNILCAQTQLPFPFSSVKENFTVIIPDNTEQLSLAQSILSKTQRMINSCTSSFTSFLQKDVNKYDKYGYTPLHYAIMKKNEDLITNLIQNKANINMKSKDNSYPIHDALSTKDFSIIRLIVNLKADVNLENDSKYKPMFCCMINFFEFDMIKILAEAKADLNIKHQTHTPGFYLSVLHHAITARKLDVIQLLIGHNANINEDIHHEKAWSLAKRYGITMELERSQKTPQEQKRTIFFLLWCKKKLPLRIPKYLLMDILYFANIPTPLRPILINTANLTDSSTEIQQPVTVKTIKNSFNSISK